jgi:hypothetical protein
MLSTKIKEIFEIGAPCRCQTSNNESYFDNPLLAAFSAGSVY